MYDIYSERTPDGQAIQIMEHGIPLRSPEFNAPVQYRTLLTAILGCLRYLEDEEAFIVDDFYSEKETIAEVIKDFNKLTKEKEIPLTLEVVS